MNVIAAVAQYSGAGGWSDPDLLIGPQVYVGGQSDEQARAQFTMWCLFPANLIISQNVLAWSDYALETYSNSEAIAINQDPLASPAFRILGSDLQFPCAPDGLATVTAVPCNNADVNQQWTFNQAQGTLSPNAFSAQGGVLDAFQCGSADGNKVFIYPNDNGQGTCNGKNQKWQWYPNGTIVNANSGSCLDVYDFAGPAVDTWTCNGGVNQQFTMNAAGLIATTAAPGKPSLCLSVSPVSPSSCTNVWGRVLSQGSYALGFVNNGPSAANITCGPACFAALNVTAKALLVRDVWAHQDIGKLVPPFSFSAPVNGSGFAALYKLTPL